MSDPITRLAAALTGRYRVEREIGAGGMATVFLGHDERHDRPVAIKVLHPDLGAALGAERFLAEIKTTARLQHPHILPLLDSGEADGLLFYVMPYVAGESLRQRLSREKLLPVDEAVRLAREVADALTLAHAQGVVHRDIKPENILLQQGHALVADFGIALAVQTAGGQRMTQTGLSLGTPQYMAPEQAMGERAIDARADVYALGAVTYEMLTGDPPFSGNTVQAIVAKVLTERPTPPTATRDTVPRGVERAVLRALAKLPADRFAGAAEFGAALTAGLLAADLPTDVGPDAALASAPTGRRATLVLAAATLVLAVVAFAVGRTTASVDAGPLGPIGSISQVTWEPGLEVTPVISPDGKTVVYAVSNGTQSRLYARNVAGGRALPLTNDSAAVEFFPQWAADGSRILYLRDSAGTMQPFSVEATGGTPRPELAPRTRLGMATWSPDGARLAFGTVDSLFVRERDGTVRFVARAPQFSLCDWGPRDLLVCAVGNLLYLTPGVGFGNIAPSRIATIDLRDGHVRELSDNRFMNHSPRWSADGRTVFFVSNRMGTPDLFSVPVDDKGAAAGDARRLTTGLGAWSFSLSADGRRLAYSVRNASANVYRTPFPPLALVGAPRQQLTFGQQLIENFAVSADGAWLYFDSDLSGNPDLYRMRLPLGTPERLTSDPTSEFAPEPSPDGKTVVFHSLRSGSREVYLLPLDGGPIRRVTDTPNREEAVARWSPDGRRLLMLTIGAADTLLMAEADAGGMWKTRSFGAPASWPTWSPDGGRIAYATTIFGGGLRVTPSDSFRPSDLYDASAPGAPITETSVWSADGRTIYFKTHSARGDAVIMAVPATGGVPRAVMQLGDDRLRSGRYGFRVMGGYIYYVLQDQQANVSVAEIGVP
jgi:Tol biopolymer transport system component